MSHKMTAAELHAAAEDERSALARTRKLEQHEADVLARAHARHARRAQPLMPSVEHDIEDPDFPGCYW